MMLFFLAAILIAVTNACIRLRVDFDREANFKGEYLIDGLLNNRPVYKLDWRVRDKPLFLYSWVSGDVSRWVIGDAPGGEAAMAFVSSWAIQPHVISKSDPKAKWKMITTTGRWTMERVRIICVGGIDFTVYLTSETQPWLTGFYFPTKQGIGLMKHASSNMYLMRAFGGDRWYIGPETDPKTTTTQAFIESTAIVPGQMLKSIPDKQLGCIKRFVDANDKDAFCGFETNVVKCPYTCSRRDRRAKKRSEHNLQTTVEDAWVEVTDFEVISKEDGSLWDYLRQKRYNKVRLQPSHTLSNGVRYPIVGFGTGGLHARVAGKQVENAMNAGYVLIDTSQAYKNEREIGNYLARKGKNARDDMFLQSKVWPTHLGYRETIEVLEDSLANMRTAYLDSFLIHWPECIENVDWMDCSGVVNVNGTWQSSWQALRKYYSEGKLMSIGVSNFDVGQIHEAMQTGTPPHIVQNFMDFWEVSPELEYCKKHDIFLQAYASLRPLAQGKRAEQEGLLVALTHVYNKSKYQIANRAILQQGCGVIPRTKAKSRLRENINIFDFMLSERELKAITGQEEWNGSGAVKKKEEL